VPAKYAELNLKEEIKWLGWEEGAVSPELRAMFDDFCDSSEQGMRCALSFLIPVASDIRSAVNQNKGSTC
jgi:hypothetical protein